MPPLREQPRTSPEAPSPTPSASDRVGANTQAQHELSTANKPAPAAFGDNYIQRMHATAPLPRPETQKKTPSKPLHAPSRAPETTAQTHPTHTPNNDIQPQWSPMDRFKSVPLSPAERAGRAPTTRQTPETQQSQKKTPATRDRPPEPTKIPSENPEKPLKRTESRGTGARTSRESEAQRYNRFDFSDTAAQGTNNTINNTTPNSDSGKNTESSKTRIPSKPRRESLSSEKTVPNKRKAEPVKPVTEPVKPVTEPVKPVTEPVKPVTEPVKPVTEPVKPVTEPVKPVTEPVKPATSGSGFPEGIDRNTTSEAFGKALDTIDPALKNNADEKAYQTKRSLFESVRAWKKSSGEQPYKIPDDVSVTPEQQGKFENHINTFRPQKNPGTSPEPPQKGESKANTQTKPVESEPTRPTSESTKSESINSTPTPVRSEQPIGFGDVSKQRTVPPASGKPEVGQTLYYRDSASQGIAPSGVITKVEKDTVHYKYTGPDGTTRNHTMPRSELTSNTNNYFTGDNSGMTDAERDAHGLKKPAEETKKNTFKDMEDGSYEVSAPDGNGLRSYLIGPGKTIGPATILHVWKDPSGDKNKDIIQFRNGNGEIGRGPLKDIIDDWTKTTN